MKMEQLIQADESIQADDSLRSRVCDHLKSATTTQRVYAAKMSASKSHALMKLAATTIFLTLCCIGAIWLAGSLQKARPVDSTTTESSTASSINPSLEQNTVVSLVELRGVAYALHIDGTLLVKNGSETPIAMMVLPTDRIVTDGLNLYYANGASLFELDVVTGTSTEVWHADTNVRLVSASHEWYIILNETANSSSRYNLCTISRKTSEVIVIESDQHMYYDSQVLSTDENHILLRGENKSLVIIGTDGRNRTILHEGPVDSACLTQDKVWFTTMQLLPGQNRNNPIIPPRFYTIGLTGDNLQEQETSGDLYASIRVIPFDSRLALYVHKIIGKDENDQIITEPGLSVMVVEPETGTVTPLWRTNDSFSGFNITEHYYCGAKMDNSEQFTLVFEQFSN